MSEEAEVKQDAIPTPDVTAAEKDDVTATEKDRRHTDEINRYWNQYVELRQMHQSQSIVDPELETFRWMIEELRVSLFAQQLGTCLTVSPKRLEKQLAKIRRV